MFEYLVEQLVVELHLMGKAKVGEVGLFHGTTDSVHSREEELVRSRSAEHVHCQPHHHSHSFEATVLGRLVHDGVKEWLEVGFKRLLHPHHGFHERPALSEEGEERKKPVPVQ